MVTVTSGKIALQIGFYSSFSKWKHVFSFSMAIYIYFFFKNKDCSLVNLDWLADVFSVITIVMVEILWNVDVETTATCQFLD